MKKIFTPKVYICLLFLFASSLLLSSCSDSGNNAIPPEPQIKTGISPVADAGTIEQNGDRFEARANGGHVFAFWVVLSETDTTYITTEKLHASPDTTRKIVAQFDDIEAGLDGYTSSHDGQFVYFINNFVDVPVSDDFPPKIELSHRIYQYNVDTGEKKVLFASGHQLNFLHISNDDQFLSFGKLAGENRFDLQVFNIDRKTIRNVGAGVQSAWANNSLKLISGNEQGLYIYDVATSSTEFIADKRIIPSINIVPSLTQARWSPDDKNILFSVIPLKDDSRFLRYNFAEHTVIEQSVEGLAFGTFYVWINPTDFIIVGNSPTYRIFRYSLTSKKAQRLPSQTFYTVGISPDKKFLAYSPMDVNGETLGRLNIYDTTTGKTQTLAEELFSQHIRWNSSDFFLTNTSRQGIVMVSFPGGKITQI